MAKTDFINGQETFVPEGQFIYSQTIQRESLLRQTLSLPKSVITRKTKWSAIRTILFVIPTCPKKPSPTCGAI